MQLFIVPAPGQSGSGNGLQMGDLACHFRAFVEIIAGQFAPDAAKVAMDPQHIAARVDERCLRLGEPADRCLAPAP